MATTVKLTKKMLSDLHKSLERESLELLGIGSALKDADQTWGEFAFSDQRSRDAHEADPAVIERHVLSQLALSNSDADLQVRRALEKMNEGTYGSCDVCLQAITVERLQARPRSVLCINCA